MNFTSTADAFKFFGIMVVLIYVFYIYCKVLIKKSPGATKSRWNDVFDSNFRNFDFSDNNIKFKFIEEWNSQSIFYTKKNTLHIIDKNRLQVNYIETKDILDIQVQVYSNEKNVKRLVALTSTYDKKTKPVEVCFKVTTTSNTCTMSIALLNNPNAYMLIESMNRLKLIIEKDMKELNNELNENR